MRRLAAPGPEDIVYDLGSGDGRVVIGAARDFGARGVGIELDPRLVALSRANAERAGIADRVRFLQQDLFETNLAEATIVTLYLAPNLNLRLLPALQRLRAGTRIVSHGSGLGDWRPDRRTTVRKDVYLWIVPAQVAGRWRGTLGSGAGERRFEMGLTQRHQDVSGVGRLHGVPAPLWDARLEADRLSFVVVDEPGTEREEGLYFSGRVGADAIEGVVRRGAGSGRSEHRWRATRERN
jgi:SAM-dependent methyltransferase